jgi:adenylate cyclase
MKKRHKYQTLFQFLGLVVLYVFGLQLFLYLKLLGISELEAATDAQRGSILPTSTVMALVIALSIGLLELKLFSKWDHFSFRKYLLCKYTLISLTILGGSIVIYFLSATARWGLSAGTALKSIPPFLHSGMFLSIFIYLFLFSIFLNMFKTVSEHLGPQAMLGALFGKYHQPLEEDRTFIFIDLQSSTTLAEKLGHVQYSLFIDRCFQVLTGCIYEFNASLYQFVGDEAVLSWKTASAKKTLAPVNLYYAFAGMLEAERKNFMNQFDEEPHFKAAIHAGLVTVTLIRSTKMDIVYHGDVLNTCARIVGECSRLKKDLLVSATVAQWMDHDAEYSVAFTESLLLRGKGAETAIYEVKKRKMHPSIDYQKE